MIQINDNEKHLDGVDGDADTLGPGVFGIGLGATTETKIGNEWFSQELEQTKKSRFSLCLVKEKLLKVIIIHID